jgi:hypothetical protein
MREVIFPGIPPRTAPARPAPVFGGDDKSKPADPPPPAQAPPVRTESKLVEVPENAPGDVFTGIFVDDGDTVTLMPDPNAKIESGVWGTGANGPAGWNTLDHDPKFPINGLPTGVKVKHPMAYPFCLLYRIGNGSYPGVQAGVYQYAGATTTFPVPEGVAKLPLYLRINDDTPGNGKGSFKAIVTVIHRTP